jgi:hypothetical protein
LGRSQAVHLGHVAPQLGGRLVTTAAGNAVDGGVENAAGKHERQDEKKDNAKVSALHRCSFVVEADDNSDGL